MVGKVTPVVSVAPSTENHPRFPFSVMSPWSSPMHLSCQPWAEAGRRGSIFVDRDGFMK